MIKPTLLSSLRPAVLALLIICAGTHAKAGPVSAGADGGGWLDGYNRLVFRFNGMVNRQLDDAAAWFGRGGPEAPRRHVRGGLGNMASNLINEPITIVSSLAVGDLSTARRATERFAVNATIGFLGWYDRAVDYGLPPVHSDIGLALCRYGVGEGGYFMLPFIGPRTVRDAVADVVIVNAILWTSLAAALGTGASLQTILIAETVEIAADIVATRQIDPHAMALGGLDYDATRREYLEQRRARCGIPVVAAPPPAL